MANAEVSEPTDQIAAMVTERITAYLTGGGLWNPELANHAAVRDLLIDARGVLNANKT